MVGYLPAPEIAVRPFSVFLGASPSLPPPHPLPFGLFPRVYPLLPLYYPLLPLYFPLFTRILVYDSGKWTLWRGVFRLELVRRWVPGLADGSIA